MKYNFLSMIFLCIVSTFNLKAQSIITRHINSQFDEQAPILSPDGKYLFFTLAHNEHNVGGTKDKGDIWYAIWQDSVWSLPFHGGRVLNNQKWNGVVGFDARGSMYLHHHYQDNKQGISIAKKKEDYWEKPVNVGIPYFLNRSENQSGSLSPDGLVMLLSLESYGTIGAEDIYVSFKKNNKWSEPRSVGSVINTRFQEMTPVIAADNKTIFFASNGLKGKGSMDIYKTTRLDSSWLNWSLPLNVKEVNTEARELSFNIDVKNNLSWYVSTKDSDGYGDIRFIKSEQLLNDIKKGVLSDSISIEKSQNNVKATRLDLGSNILVGSIRNIVDSTGVIATIRFVATSTDSTIEKLTDNMGGYEILLNYNETYSVKISASNYLPHLENFVMTDSVEVKNKKNYWLTAVKIGEAVQLEHVLFERGKSMMLPTSFADLDAVVEMLLDNPTMEIVLAGHTDNQGSSKLNYKLSEDRVEAVIQYIVGKGISSKRITGKGFGGTQPIASNANPTTRKLNRRVEFTIVKN